MFRALIELLVTIILALAARAIFSSLMKGVGNAAAGGFGQRETSAPPPPPQAGKTGDLFKDPVCGTYVSEATRFKRQVSGATVYYCSDACREKDAGRF